MRRGWSAALLLAAAAGSGAAAHESSLAIHITTLSSRPYLISGSASGGSFGSSQLADALPGLFDGVLISSTFPDPLGIAFSGADGHLLTHYFAANPSEFTSRTRGRRIRIQGYDGISRRCESVSAHMKAACS
jgi:hypothetical protein